MIIPPIESIVTKEEARDFALRWQIWQSEQSLSWEESLAWNMFFEHLAFTFDLLEEFKENGII